MVHVRIIEKSKSRNKIAQLGPERSEGPSVAILFMHDVCLRSDNFISECSEGPGMVNRKVVAAVW